MKNKNLILLGVPMLLGLLSGCGKQTKQLTITMVTHDNMIFLIHQDREHNDVVAKTIYDVKIKDHSNSITVNYSVGDTYRDILTDSIFVVEPGRDYDVDPSTWGETTCLVEFNTYLTRYGQTPHFSLKEDMSDVFKDWNKEVSGDKLYIQAYIDKDYYK